MLKKSFAIPGLVLLVTACMAVNVEEPTPTPAPPLEASCQGVEFSPADNGDTLRVQKGSHLVFVAEGNPTTGYNWFAKGFNVALLGHDPEKDEYSLSSNLIGAGGTLRMCLDAIAAGETPLELLYERPWESGTVEPLERISVTVVILE